MGDFEIPAVNLQGCTRSVSHDQHEALKKQLSVRDFPFSWKLKVENHGEAVPTR